jgi:hypothetical protein
MKINGADVAYEKDFYIWALHNADLLREGKIAEIDSKNIAEELESMGKRDKRQLINRLIVLMLHLLKWEFQKRKRSKSWKSSIVEQRRRILQLLEDSPSLLQELENKLNYTYAEAVKQASMESGLDISVFPEENPYSKEQLLDDSFYPTEN